jgi:hypothetical protein
VTRRRCTWGLAAAAVLAVVLCVAAPGPVRVPAGLLLCCYLPGRLAVEALFPPASTATGSTATPSTVDGYLRTVLSVALSLVVTMAVGLAVVLMHAGLRTVPVCAGLLAACLVLGVAAYARGDQPLPVRWPDRHTASRYILASLPALLLTIVLVIQVLAVARYRSADSEYTQLAAQPSGDGGQVAVIRSHERHPVDFRYEQLVDGGTVRSAWFTLRPGQAVEYPLSGPAGHIEVLLYRAGQTSPYRRLLP